VRAKSADFLVILSAVLHVYDSSILQLAILPLDVFQAEIGKECAFVGAHQINR
jgi:hypothetical protein